MHQVNVVHCQDGSHYVKKEKKRKEKMKHLISAENRTHVLLGLSRESEELRAP